MTVTRRLPGIVFIRQSEEPELFIGSEPSNKARHRAKHGYPSRPLPKAPELGEQSPMIPGMRAFNRDSKVYIRVWIDRNLVEQEGAEMPSVGDRLGLPNFPTFTVTKLSEKEPRKDAGGNLRHLVEVIGMIDDN
jgi:hypothetical protein